jgi:ribose-phosphate pyrophosphokinase
MSRNGYSVVACEGGRYLGEKLDLLLQGEPNYKRLVPYEEKKFPNGEILPILYGPVRGRDLYVVQAVTSPTLKDKNLNDNLIALVLTIEAAKKADAESITAVVPKLPYDRQERRSGKEVGRREPISACYIAKMIENAGAQRVITLDVHTEAVEGLYEGSFDNLYTTNLIMPALQANFSQYLSNACLSSLDLGGMKRTAIYARRLGLPMAVVYKEKDESTGKIRRDRMVVIGDVSNKYVLTVDDIVSSGGTFHEGTLKLIEEGALGIILACSHPEFSGNAINMLDELYNSNILLGVVATNSIWHGSDFSKVHNWFYEVDISPAICNTIKTIQAGGSLHKLLDVTKEKA